MNQEVIGGEPSIRGDLKTNNIDVTQGENLEDNIEVTQQNEIMDQVPNEILINSSSGEQSILIKCYDP